MLRIIHDSGWRGDVGILSHVAERDAAETLARNLAGYERLMEALTRETGGDVGGTSVPARRQP
jgi:hypothetical protein